MIIFIGHGLLCHYNYKFYRFSKIKYLLLPLIDSLQNDFYDCGCTAWLVRLGDINLDDKQITPVQDDKSKPLSVVTMPPVHSGIAAGNVTKSASERKNDMLYEYS